MDQLKKQDIPVTFFNDDDKKWNEFISANGHLINSMIGLAVAKPDVEGVLRSKVYFYGSSNDIAEEVLAHESMHAYHSQGKRNLNQVMLDLYELKRALLEDGNQEVLNDFHELILSLRKYNSIAAIIQDYLDGNLTTPQAQMNLRAVQKKDTEIIHTINTEQPAKEEISEAAQRMMAYDAFQIAESTNSTRKLKDEKYYADKYIEENGGRFHNEGGFEIVAVKAKDLDFFKMSRQELIEQQSFYLDSQESAADETFAWIYGKFFEHNDPKKNPRIGLRSNTNRNIDRLASRMAELLPQLPKAQATFVRHLKEYGALVPKQLDKAMNSQNIPVSLVEILSVLKGKANEQQLTYADIEYIRDILNIIRGKHELLEYVINHLTFFELYLLVISIQESSQDQHLFKEMTGRVFKEIDDMKALFSEARGSMPEGATAASEINKLELQVISWKSNQQFESEINKYRSGLSEDNLYERANSLAGLLMIYQRLVLNKKDIKVALEILKGNHSIVYHVSGVDGVNIKPGQSMTLYPGVDNTFGEGVYASQVPLLFYSGGEGLNIPLDNVTIFEFPTDEKMDRRLSTSKDNIYVNVHSNARAVRFEVAGIEEMTTQDLRQRGAITGLENEGIGIEELSKGKKVILVRTKAVEFIEGYKETPEYTAFMDESSLIKNLNKKATSSSDYLDFKRQIPNDAKLARLRGVINNLDRRIVLREVGRNNFAYSTIALIVDVVLNNNDQEVLEALRNNSPENRKRLVQELNKIEVSGQNAKLNTFIGKINEMDRAMTFDGLKTLFKNFSIVGNKNGKKYELINPNQIGNEVRFDINYMLTGDVVFKLETGFFVSIERVILADPEDQNQGVFSAILKRIYTALPNGAKIKGAHLTNDPNLTYLVESIVNEGKSRPGGNYDDLFSQSGFELPITTEQILATVQRIKSNSFSDDSVGEEGKTKAMNDCLMFIYQYVKALGDKNNLDVIFEKRMLGKSFKEAGFQTVHLEVGLNESKEAEINIIAQKNQAMMANFNNRIKKFTSIGLLSALTLYQAQAMDETFLEYFTKNSIATGINTNIQPQQAEMLINQELNQTIKRYMVKNGGKLASTKIDVNIITQKFLDIGIEEHKALEILQQLMDEGYLGMSSKDMLYFLKDDNTIKEALKKDFPDKADKFWVILRQAIMTNDLDKIFSKLLSQNHSPTYQQISDYVKNYVSELYKKLNDKTISAQEKSELSALQWQIPYWVMEMLMFESNFDMGGKSSQFWSLYHLFLGDPNDSEHKKSYVCETISDGVVLLMPDFGLPDHVATVVEVKKKSNGAIVGTDGHSSVLIRTLAGDHSLDQLNLEPEKTIVVFDDKGAPQVVNWNELAGNQMTGATRGDLMLNENGQVDLFKIGIQINDLSNWEGKDMNKVIEEYEKLKKEIDVWEGEYHSAVAKDSVLYSKYEESRQVVGDSIPKAWRRLGYNDLKEFIKRYQDLESRYNKKEEGADISLRKLNSEIKDKINQFNKTPIPQVVYIYGGKEYTGKTIMEGLLDLSSTIDDLLNNKNPNHAMITPGFQQKGGIDLTPANLHLQTQNLGGAIHFHLDPAMLQKLQNAPGFVPVVIGIKPMTDLQGFLGLADSGLYNS